MSKFKSDIYDKQDKIEASVIHIQKEVQEVKKCKAELEK